MPLQKPSSRLPALPLTVCQAPNAERGSAFMHLLAYSIVSLVTVHYFAQFQPVCGVYAGKHICLANGSTSIQRFFKLENQIARLIHV